MTELLFGFLQAGSYLLLAMVFIFVAKKLADNAFRRDGQDLTYDADMQIESESNMALALRRGGLYLGMGIGLIGTISSGGSYGYMEGLLLTLKDGVFITIFLLVNRYFAEHVLMTTFNNNQAIRNKNVAVGFFEAGAYIATGLVAYASFTGVGGPWWGSLVYFVIGQAALLLIVRLYEMVTPWEVQKEIAGGNAAAGLMLAGIMIATGFILRGAIAGPFGGWTNDLTALVLSLTSGLIFLMLIFTHLIDNFLFNGTSLEKEICEDRNIAAIAVVVSIKVALALVVGAIVL